MSGFFTLSHSAVDVEASTRNRETGVTTGVMTDLLRLEVTNTPPYNLSLSLKLGGLATTTYTSIKDGKTILGVDEVKADLVGTGVDEQGVSAVVFGSVNVLGRVTEVK